MHWWGRFLALKRLWHGSNGYQILLIESLSAAGLILQQINSLIQQVNEGKADVQRAMGAISDFGEALNEFESSRKQSTFRPLSKQDILRLQMLRRQQERYQADLRNLLLVADPKLLEDYDKACREQAEAKRRFDRIATQKRKARRLLIQKIMVGGTTAILGGAVAIGALWLVILMFGP